MKATLCRSWLQEGSSKEGRDGRLLQVYKLSEYNNGHYYDISEYMKCHYYYAILCILTVLRENYRTFDFSYH